MTLVKQPTLAPTRKVMATALVGAAITVAVWVADQFYQVSLPGDVQAALHTAAATAIAYFVRDHAVSLQPNAPEVV